MHLFPRRMMATVAALGIAATGLVATATPAHAESVAYDGVTLEWFGNVEMQSLALNGQANYFSAGTSDGKQATYAATQNDVSILHRDASGADSPATWSTRGAQTSGTLIQLVRLSDGDAVVESDGSAVVTWAGSFSVNFYGGSVPFTFTNPELTVSADGVGTLTADMSGYASSLEDPLVKVPLTPANDVSVATFADVSLSTTGLTEVQPDYQGVTLVIPEGQTAQNTTSTGWGAWPQSFVDFQFQTGLSSYWYSSGSAMLDPKKPPMTFDVDFTDAVEVDPTDKVDPELSMTAPTSPYGKSATVTVTVSDTSATGSVTLGGPGVNLASTLSNGKATFTLPATLPVGTRPLMAAYAGDDHFHPATVTRNQTVTKTAVTKPTWKVTKKPTPKKAGKAKVAITSKVAAAPASGKVTVTLTKGKGKGKGKTKVTIKAKAKKGAATVTVPKLAKGTWKVSIAYAGSATHKAASAKAGALKVS